MFSTCSNNSLPFSSNLKLMSANSFNLEESKICDLGKSKPAENLKMAKCLHSCPPVLSTQANALKPLSPKHVMMELTGFVIIQIMASGHTWAHASTKSRTMPAFVLKRSSLVIPVNVKNVGFINWIFSSILDFNPFPNKQILDSSKLKEFADDNFKLDEKDKVLQTGRKQCGQRRNCLLQAISPFPTLFSVDQYCRHVKTWACLGKEQCHFHN